MRALGPNAVPPAGARYSAGWLFDPMKARSRSRSVWLRRALLALPLALALGGCTMVQADPVDRATIGPLSPLQASAPHATVTDAADDGSWRLRLSRL
ncbi:MULTISPECIES: hypothetical protein [unclassified Methylobacterium]|uniref:hypothetical protein n=1 Tax=unclassified Methylobacterium TaxID=2615210 RepID=UPI002269A945|nr:MULTISPECIES: hypothetical protein [unclassified Methylobacterium]